MNSYDAFVRALKKHALADAIRKKSVYGAEQAENDAVHMVGDGLALVEVAAATQSPEQAALHYARYWDSSPLTEPPQEAQWALCPLTKYQAFLHLVDVGAAARDALRSQGHGDQIRQDAETIVKEEDLKDITPLHAASTFLFAWPDLGGAWDDPWLTRAYQRSQRNPTASLHN